MPFPKHLSDESLYSRLIRHQAILGMSEKEYLKQIFNNPRLSIHPFLTVGLKEVAQITGEKPLDIFKNQTLGSLFMHFMPESGLKIYQSLLKNDGNAAFRQSCLSNFRETKKLTINHCSECAVEDIQNYGISYWHRIHQIPGIECCPIHNTRLIENDLPARPHIKSGFLPNPAEATFCNDKHGDFSRFCQNSLQKISKTKKYFILDNLKFSLIDTGYITKSGQVRRKLLLYDFQNFFDEIDFNNHDLLPKSESDYRYITNLLSSNSAQHPFKYILRNFFLEHYPQKTLDFEVELPLTEPSKSRENESVEYLKRGISLAEVSRKTGWSVSYLKRLAGLNNIEVLREPILLTRENQAIELKMAWKGFHQRIIASKFGVSIGAIEMLISSESGLVGYRKKCKYESKRRRYKVEILRAVMKSPRWIRQQIKTNHSSAYFWLFSNEKGWFNQNLPKATAPICNPKVNWQARDSELAKTVSEILSVSNQKMSLTKLEQIISYHGLIKNKHRLPKTMKIYDNYTKK